jgi:DNA invertase Pin-like site-specific DNA recombinase
MSDQPKLTSHRTRLVHAMDGPPLGRLEQLGSQISELMAEQDLVVSRARASGATWTEIARALGCSTQAAHKRYRWVRHSDRTSEVWHERPLPM